jgi:hypothetical protein
MRLGLMTLLSCVLVATFGLSSTASARTGSAISADGKYQVFIKPLGDGAADGNSAEAIVLVDKRTGTERQLLVSRFDDDYKKNLTNLDAPLFSLDSGFVYVTSNDASPYRSAVHQINVRTGQTRFVSNGTALSVIRTGPYRGFLVIQRHKQARPPENGTINPVFVVRPDGTMEFLVPGSENEYGELAVAPWLAKRGWHAW